MVGRGTRFQSQSREAEMKIQVCSGIPVSIRERRFDGPRQKSAHITMVEHLGRQVMGGFMMFCGVSMHVICWRTGSLSHNTL